MPLPSTRPVPGTLSVSPVLSAGMAMLTEAPPPPGVKVAAWVWLGRLATPMETLPVPTAVTVAVSAPLFWPAPFTAAAPTGTLERRSGSAKVLDAVPP